MEINLIIDGKTVKADSNATILEVARANGVEIPTLCYLKGVNTPASCRVCVVEVEGARNLVTACSTKVREGMVVRTNTTKVLKARKTAIELLLSNHNKNCLSCPKNLKCDFQRLCEQFRCDTEKFAGAMTEGKKDDSNHSLVRDDSKCILCGKCIAVCAARQGCSAIGKINRGFETKVGTAFDSPMQESTCVGCGQCILVCPTAALTQKNDLDPVLEILDKKDVIKVAQVAPAVRVAIGEEFGAEIGTFSEGKMVSALRACGFDFVFDVNNGADFTVIEEANELLGKLEKGDKLPLFTSCCPAWFNYCEKFYPEFVGNMSTTKSPNEMLGSLVKYYFEQKGKKVEIVSVMPCTAKKREILAHGVIDNSITTRELGELIRLKGIDFNALPEGKFDDPFGEYSGGALIFGVTGGVTEAALRYAVHKLTGKKQDIIEDVRYSEGVKEVTVDVAGTKLNLAIVHGLANTPKVLDAIKSGEKTYHFVEVMACRRGCIAGGGQPLPIGPRTRASRAEGIYAVDRESLVRFTDDNPLLAKAYEDVIAGKEHKLLHRNTH